MITIIHTNKMKNKNKKAITVNNKHSIEGEIGVRMGI